MQEEAVQDAVELVHGWEVDLQDEAVLAGHAVALHDLRDRLGQSGDARQLAGVGANADEGGEGETEGGGIDLEAHAPDHPGLLQTSHPLGHCRGRHAYAAGKRGHR